MNVLYLGLTTIDNVSTRGIYSDLFRKFRDEGHHVFVVRAIERRYNQRTLLERIDGVVFLKVKTLNIRSTNVVEKGLSTVTIEMLFKRAIKKYFKDVSFDVIMYSTPPITFVDLVKYLKKKNPHAMSYLILKDIFPQNALDLGMFGKKSLAYKYFRKKEIALYKISDYIGCMSPANVEFVIRNNDFVEKERVEIAPNSIEVQEKTLEPGQEEAERHYIRKKYDLPTDKPIFIYGGNLGKPQGIDFIIKCMEAVKNRFDCYFVVVGSGTEKDKLDDWYERQDHDDNLAVKVMSYLPKCDYDMLVKYCDVGLIFLDHRFTIPNYPSRLLSYLENKMPVLCATDVNTDIGKIAEENGYGYWCESVKPEDFTALVDKMLASDMKAMGENGYEFLKQNYLVEHTYRAIMKHFEER